MALDRCGTKCANALCRSPSTTECRFDDGKKSECSRRKPRVKFDANFESLSCRLWFFELSSNRFDKKLFFGFTLLLLLLLALALASFKLLLLLILFAENDRIGCCACSCCLREEPLVSGVVRGPTTAVTFCSDVKPSAFCVWASFFNLSDSDGNTLSLVRSAEKNRSISQSRSNFSSLDEDFSELADFSAF